jgi:ABC-type transport system involved in cytochrome c biogenesis permease component
MNKNVQLNALSIYKVFLAILCRQLSIFIKNKAFIISSIFLFLSSIAILRFLQGSSINAETFKIIEILFIIYSITLSSDLIIVEDYKKGLFEQFLLTGVILEFFLLGKIVASFVMYGLLYVPIMIIMDFFIYSYRADNVAYLLLVKLLIVFNITINALVSSSFLLSFKKRISQILISVFINIPTIIISSLCYISDDQFYSLLLISIFLLTTPLFILLSSYVIKISIEEDN